MREEEKERESERGRKKAAFQTSEEGDITEYISGAKGRKALTRQFLIGS